MILPKHALKGGSVPGPRGLTGPRDACYHPSMICRAD